MGAFESRSPEIEPQLSTDPTLPIYWLNFPAASEFFIVRSSAQRGPISKKMTSEDFWEVGASGRRYSRKNVLDELEKRHTTPHKDVWQTKDFHCRKLALDTYLLTYTLLQDNERLTRRSTISQATPDGWKIVFHQGTIVQDA